MDDLSYVDIEKLAREAELIEPSDVWADLPADYTQALSRFAALVLEKAAEEEGQPGIYSKHDFAEHLRAMSAALQSGDRG